MAWTMEPCPGCGGRKAVVAKMCRKCVHANAASTVCPSCGGRMTQYSKICRPCKKAQSVYWHPCPGCGKTIQASSKQCLDCYKQGRTKKVYTCVDCGAETSRPSSKSHYERCGDCARKRQKPEDRGTCVADGCQQPHASRGFCLGHFRSVYGKPRTGTRNTNLKKILALWPCQICGYDRMKSAVHRLHPGANGGEYVPGNMVALCARCHREVHEGITLPPSAPTEAEILADPVR